MYLTNLQVTDFRSWQHADLDLARGVTTLVGPNGMGKTNLVEAVGYVATLGSHRAATTEPLVRVGAAVATVRAALVRGDRPMLVEVEIVPGRTGRARVNRAPVRRVRDILGTVRTVLFAPEDLAVVRGDPSHRRRFLDDLLVVRAPRYAAVRADYDRALRQRTALLKSAPGGRRAAASEAVSSTLDVWDGHLATAGAELLAGRLDLVADLSPLVGAAYERVSGRPGTVGTRYRSSLLAPTQADGGLATQARAVSAVSAAPRAVAVGAVDPSARSLESAPVPASASVPAPVPASASVPASVPASESAPASVPASRDRPAPSAAAGPTGSARPGGQSVSELTTAMVEAMARRRPDELDRGVCLVGPHRDDLLLDVGALPSRGYASHGESWTLALALRLASYDLLRADGDEPVLILDDVFAELDPARRERLAASVASAEQVLVTAASREDVPSILDGVRLHVEDGRVERG